jgi:tetratricopeptide (TPR) repeat protein
MLLAAGAAGHRAKAERAEALGRMADAAREYEAAWDEEQAPELLYRLGVVRRKLREYGKAREALRAYLRLAPEGGLREEVERQLAKIEVLIEAERENYIDPPRRKRAPAVEVAPPAPPPSPFIAAVPVPEPVPVSPPPAVARAAPAAVVEPVIVPPVRSRAVPWLFGASAVALGVGAALWWDGARVSNQLDARFAAGDLSAADRPLFGRARGESIAGRVLVAAGVGLLAGAVALWW